MASSPRSERDGGVIEPTELSMALPIYLGERLNKVLVGNNSTFDFINTASVFSITQSDIDLFYRQRGNDPPASNYLENFRNWSDQKLPRKGEEEVIKPAEEQTLAEKPAETPSDGDRSKTAEEEGEGCAGEESC